MSLLLAGCATMGPEREVPSETLWGMAEGRGATRQEAVQDGLKRLIEQVMGVFLQGEMTVERSRVIQDEIMAYSKGYVERYHLLEETTEPDGSFKTVVFGGVRREAFQRRLKAIGALHVEGTRESLNAALAQDRRATADRLAVMTFDLLMRKHWRVSVEGFEHRPLPTGQVHVQFTIQVDGQPEEWQRALKPLLYVSEIAPAGERPVGLSSCMIAVASLDKIDRFQKPQLIELQKWSAKPFEGFPVWLPEEAVRGLVKMAKNARMMVRMKNSSGEVIADGAWKLKEMGNDWQEHSLLLMTERNHHLQLTVGGLTRPCRVQVTGTCRVEDLRDMDRIEAQVITTDDAPLDLKRYPPFQVVFRR